MNIIYLYCRRRHGGSTDIIIIVIKFFKETKGTDCISIALFRFPMNCRRCSRFADFFIIFLFFFFLWFFAVIIFIAKLFEETHCTDSISITRLRFPMYSLGFICRRLTHLEPRWCWRCTIFVFLFLVIFIVTKFIKKNSYY